MDQSAFWPTLFLSGNVDLPRIAVRKASDQALIHSDCYHVLTTLMYAGCTQAWSGVPHHLPQEGSRTILEALDRPEASLYRQEAGRTHPDSTYKSREAGYVTDIGPLKQLSNCLQHIIENNQYR